MTVVRYKRCDNICAQVGRTWVDTQLIGRGVEIRNDKLDVKLTVEEARELRDALYDYFTELDKGERL